MSVERRRAPGDIIDRATGRVRVLSRRCDTCLFRRQGRQMFGEDRVAEVTAANLEAGALLTCHGTLPYGENPDFGPAACAGFWARHHRDVLAGRYALLFLGIIRVDPPRKTSPVHTDDTPHWTTDPLIDHDRHHLTGDGCACGWTHPNPDLDTDARRTAHDAHMHEVQAEARGATWEVLRQGKTERGASVISSGHPTSAICGRPRTGTAVARCRDAAGGPGASR